MREIGRGDRRREPDDGLQSSRLDPRLLLPPPDGGGERRPAAYGCACNCLPFLLLIAVGLLLGYQLGYWLAEGENRLAVALAGLLVLAGAIGLLRQAALLRRRRDR